MAVELKTIGEFQAMRAAGLILARALAAGRAAAVPGASTADVDQAVAAVIAEAGATSNFLHYAGGHGAPPFPATICSSVNDQVVHGIPSPGRVLQPGDLLSVDGGCILDGWHSDSAVSLIIGSADDETGPAHVDLIHATERAMWAGIAAIAAGARLGNVSFAIQASVLQSARVDGRRYGMVAGYGGHGIGSAMHMDPFVPNEGKVGKGPRLLGGMALAIEPMVTLGKPTTWIEEDGWTVSTRDGAWAAHFEHSVAIMDDGIAVLSAADGGAAGLAGYDVALVSLD